MADEAAAASSLQAAAALASLHLPQQGPTGGRRSTFFCFIFCSRRLELLFRLLHSSLEMLKFTQETTFSRSVMQSYLQI
jgi:hypothetical protein